MGSVRYGQHFLISDAIVEKELEYASLTKNDVVLEVGPGKGKLTFPLAERVKEVIAVEVDSYLIKSLEPTLPENVTLIQGDIVKTDLESLPRFNKVVSNLPYQVSSPFTFQLLEYDFELAVLIYQLDFALRMVAEPWEYDYSRLSVGVYYKAECEIVEEIPRTCFQPAPRVDSAMVVLKPREQAPFELESEAFFYELARELFSHRRKMIRSILKNRYNVTDDDLPFMEMRVEEMSAEEIGLLANWLVKRGVNKGGE